MPLSFKVIRCKNCIRLWTLYAHFFVQKWLTKAASFSILVQEIIKNPLKYSFNVDIWIIFIDLS